AFLLLWMCGWLVGECLVIGVIAWQLFGRELLEVSSAELVDRQKIGRLARTRSYAASQVRDITPERVPHDEESEEPRKDFCLRLSYDDAVARLGEGMGAVPDRPTKLGEGVALGSGGDRVRDACRDAAGCNPSLVAPRSRR